MTTRSDSPTFNQLLARYERVIEISQQLNSTRDHVALLRRIIAAAMELLDIEAASILLIDPSTGELRFELSADNDQAMASIVVPLEGSIAGWVVTHGEPRVIEDVSQEPNFFKNVDDTTQFKTRSVLAVPLRTYKQVIGALEAVNKRNHARFSGEDIKIATTLAGQAAIAIENARLFQQSDFMAEMVHELRTPLASLRTSAVLLQRQHLSDEQNEILGIMQGETERLIRMTSDFLDLARLESGRMRIDVAPFEMDKLALECINVVQPQAGDRGVAISTDLLPFTVEADRGKVKQVLLNLLTNAVKYNRENGQIEVKTYESIRHDEPFVEIAVQDTGNGISREDQKSMFQKFFRVADTAGSVSGTGLGLAIAKYIVEAHKGAIWLESEPGVGSTFFFTLPLANPVSA
ncbi:MAG TPA: GAF domain-containing sensor histidine kinase [Phototrophicaceae bacterium]|nr:GAF domain-containing sensor histidine kinase [Phototrophicaceae bacterium]